MTGTLCPPSKRYWTTAYWTLWPLQSMTYEILLWNSGVVLWRWYRRTRVNTTSSSEIDSPDSFPGVALVTSDEVGSISTIYFFLSLPPWIHAPLSSARRSSMHRTQESSTTKTLLYVIEVGFLWQKQSAGTVPILNVNSWFTWSPCKVRDYTGRDYHCWLSCTHLVTNRNHTVATILFGPPFCFVLFHFISHSSFPAFITCYQWCCVMKGACINDQWYYVSLSKSKLEAWWQYTKN